MRAFQIQDVKSFMSHLLLSNTFDRFLLTEASITTFNTFFIDGHLHKECSKPLKTQSKKENK